MSIASKNNKGRGKTDLGTLPRDILMPRMFSKFIVNPETLCWEWTAGKYCSGYGTIGVGGGRANYAHRVMYELMIGPIPDGLTIDHLCAVKACVNPEHMEPVTLAENVSRAAPRMRQEKCPKGHSRDGNLYVDPKGRRTCRTCKDASNRTRVITEEDKIKRAAYREEHKEHYREYYRTWAANHREELHAYQAEYRERNREKIRAATQRRKEQARQRVEAKS